MSEKLAKAVLDAKVKEVFEKSEVFKALSTNYRKQLNSRYHVLDISLNTLYSQNVKKKSARAKKSFEKYYNEFIEVILKKFKGRTYESLDSIETVPIITHFVRNPPLLISPSFTAARGQITLISQEIPNNKYFGISNRVRSLDEILRESSKTLEDLKLEGRFFDEKTGQELVLDTEGKLVPRERNLSLLDLGHTPEKELGRDSPLKEQISQASLISEKKFIFIEDASETILSTTNERIYNKILEKLDQLTNIQARAVVAFKNEVPEKLNEIFSKQGGNIGFLSLTLQLFTVNNDLSIKESSIRNKLIKEIKQEIEKTILKIPGSNTIEQDLVLALENELLKTLHNKSKQSKLQIHKSATSKTVVSSKKLVKPSKISNSIKIGKPRVTDPIKKVLPPEVSTLSLLNILNQQIAQQIRKNMGTGYSKDVLNYRTGRFAESVKVERLSESRAGMITAFYSYMKNPYATFSAGGRQEIPRSRDPKLLISKSIREIAATLVTNRLRAVNL